MVWTPAKSQKAGTPGALGAAEGCCVDRGGRLSSSHIELIQGNPQPMQDMTMLFLGAWIGEECPEAS